MYNDDLCFQEDNNRILAVLNCRKFSFFPILFTKKHSNGRLHPESAQRIEIMEKWNLSQSNEQISYDTLDHLVSKDEILSVSEKLTTVSSSKQYN